MARSSIAIAPISKAAYNDFKAQRESNRRIRDAFSDEEALIVSPLQNFEIRQPGSQPTATEPMFGYTVIQLDESYCAAR